MSITQPTDSTAANRERQWKEVQELIKKDLPQSAAEKASSLYEAAVSNGDSYNMLRGVIVLNSLESEYMEESHKKSLERLNTVQPLLSDEYRAIGKALLANFYRSYLSDSYWSVNNRSVLENPSDDIDEWDTALFRDTIKTLLTGSLETCPEITRKKSAARYRHIIDKGNRLGLKLRPTLLDVLLENAYIYDDNIQPDASWNLNIADRLLELHHNGKPDVLASILEQRFEFEDLSGQKRYDRAMELYEMFKGKSDYAARFALIAAQYLEGKEEYLKAEELCLEALKQHPRSSASSQMRNLIADMHLKTLQLSVPPTISSGHPTPGSITFRNTDRIYLQAFRSDDPIEDLYGLDLAMHLQTMVPVAEWQQSLTDNGDMKRSSSYIEIPELGPGGYYILASTDAKVGKGSSVSCQRTLVTGLIYAGTATNDKTITGYALDNWSGKGVEGCAYTLYRVTRERGREILSRLYDGTTGTDGFLSFYNITNGSYKLELKRGEDIYSRIIDVPSQTYREVPSIVRVFTDRYTYRPGDKVFYKGLLYKCDGYSIAETIADSEISVILRDANWQVIGSDTLVTDAFGSVSGSMTLPSDRLTGRYTLQISGIKERVHFSHPINVEEYRQPSFEVSIEDQTTAYSLGDDITVRGNAMLLTGFPLQQAQVTYNVTRTEFVPYWRPWVREAESVTIAQDTIVTDADGNFSITFNASYPSEEENPSFRYQVNITVSGQDGETHPASASMTISDESTHIDLNASDNYLSAPSINISLRNLQGKQIEGRVNVTIESLAEPEPAITPTVKAKDIPDGMSDRFSYLDLDGHTDITDLKTSGTVYTGVVQCHEGEISTLDPEGLEPGAYLITATAVNEKGDTLQSTDRFILQQPGGKTRGSGLLFAAAAQSTVFAGDTARVYIGSPMPGAVVSYVIVNRFGACGHGRVVTDGKLQHIDIPVTREMTGDFKVTLCTVLYGNTALSTVRFTVPFAEKRLNITLETFRDLLEPDARETWRLKIQDYKGNPVRAMLTTVMYDSSLDVYGTNVWSISPWNHAMLNSSSMLNSLWFPSISHTPVPPYEHYDEPYPQFYTLPTEFRMWRVADNIIGRRPMLMAKSMAATNTVLMAESVLEDDAVFAVAEESDSEAAQGAYAIQEEALQQEQPQKEEIQLRTDLKQTGFFMPDLITDSEGRVDITFTVPQLLTRWNVQGLAYTNRMEYDTFTRTVTTRKQLMIVPGVPRFVRQGDRIRLTANVYNLTGKDIDAKVTLLLTDAATGRVMDIADHTTEHLVLEADKSDTTGFTVNVPADAGNLVYRFTVSAEGFSDGQQDFMPVVSNRQRVTQSLTLYAGPHEKRTFSMPYLDKPSDTRQDSRLVFEYASNPVWYAIKALPMVVKQDNPDNINLFYNFYAAALAGNIVHNNPIIKETFRKWLDEEPSALESRLSTSTTLMKTALEETPWLLESQTESGQRRQTAEFYTRQNTDSLLRTTLTLLLNSQNADGGWGWIKDYESSVYVTATILYGFGQLLDIDAASEYRTPRIKNAVASAAVYLDRRYLEYYNRVEDKKKTAPVSNLDLLYLHCRAMLTDIQPVTDEFKVSYEYYLDNALDKESWNMTLYTRARLILLFDLTGHHKEAEELAQSLLDRSLYSEEMGRWWRDNTAGYVWHEAPIELQSLIIRGLLVTGHNHEAEECRQWLLKQKQTTSWDTSAATANAVFALLITAPTNQLTAKPQVNVSVGRHVIDTSHAESGTGFVWETFDDPTPDMGTVTVDSHSDDISWGALHLQFTEVIDKIEPYSNGTSITKQIYRVLHGESGDYLQAVEEGSVIHVGDRIRVRMLLSSDRTLEYVQVKDSRAAAFVPASTASGIRYNLHDDLRYYVAPGISSTSFYIDRLPKGSYVIEYDLYAEQRGTFTCGNASAFSLYAPEFGSHTGSVKVKVVE